MFGADTMAMINAVLTFFLIGGIFYFMLWKPQKKQQQERQNLLNSLKKGDKIITIGGIYGTITDISERTVKVEVAEGVEVTMVRSAVSNFQDPNHTQAE
ncbi:MAG: preprotein translocase subunit YajC [Phascolarctobacterium sp.]|nr:preprotein translocase subunit YajC [Phascolarctobacterium sp.]